VLGDVTLAAGDRGVMASHGGGPWTASGLAQARVAALAVLPAASGRLVVTGADATQGAEPVPLYASADDGRAWAPLPVAGGALGGTTVVSALVVQPADGGARLVIGTNGGVFASSDRGQGWQQLTGGGSLPAVDVSALAVSPRHPERLYAASDGGGSAQGGLWSTGDGGGHFASLAPPLPEVTAVAVSGDDPTGLAVATFRPADHLVSIWTYRDAGGQPRAQAQPPAFTIAGPLVAVPASPAGRRPAWLALLLAPEAPYVLLGPCALLVVMAALVANVRGGRPR
jgi:hypothetical protein